MMDFSDCLDRRGASSRNGHTCQCHTFRSHTCQVPQRVPLGQRPPSWPTKVGIHDCVPGMALISEVQVLYGPKGRNR